MILSDVGIWLGSLDLTGASNQVALDLDADEVDVTTWDGTRARGFVTGGRTARLEASASMIPTRIPG